MTIQLGTHKKQSPNPNTPNQDPPKPGFRTTAPTNMLDPNPKAAPVNLEASAVAFRGQSENLARCSRQVEGALNMLRATLKGNAARAGQVDAVAVSNAVNQLQNVADSLLEISTTISS